MIGPCSGLLGGALAGGGLGYGDDWISTDDMQAKFDDERISIDERQAKFDGDWTSRDDGLGLGRRNGPGRWILDRRLYFSRDTDPAGKPAG